MRTEIQARLWDIRDAIDAVLSFTEGVSSADYKQNAMLQAAVERKLEIIGEAMHQIAKIEPATTAHISDHARIIGLRHRLIHGYAQVDDEIVWGVVEEDLPVLLREVETLLSSAHSDG